MARTSNSPADGGGKITRIAARLDEAARTGNAVPQSSGDDLMTNEEAYEVQWALIQHRLGRGARRIGLKMGFTSRAKMVQMGLSDLIWGRLTSDMMVEDGTVNLL
jgi:2-oxo-3-hexenedioate decarboxylase